MKLSFYEINSMCEKGEITSYEILYALWACHVAVLSKTSHVIDDDEIVVMIENFWNYSTDELFGKSVEELLETSRTVVPQSKLGILVANGYYLNHPLYSINSALIQLLQYVYDDLRFDGPRDMHWANSFHHLTYFLSSVDPNQHEANVFYLTQIFLSSVDPNQHEANVFYLTQIFWSSIGRTQCLT